MVIFIVILIVIFIIILILFLLRIHPWEESKIKSKIKIMSQSRRTKGRPRSRLRQVPHKSPPSHGRAERPGRIFSDQRQKNPPRLSFAEIRGKNSPVLRSPLSPTNELPH